jgi:sugar lactone lactonase YvrE
MEIKQLVDCRTLLGEGPLWDVDEQRIYWIDSFGCKVFRAAPDGSEVESWNVPDKIGSMALRRKGGAVVSLRTGFHFLDLKSGDC